MWPALSLPWPPGVCVCVAARRNDVRLGLCALLRGPPVAALRLLRAPAWKHCCSRPCLTPAPSPGRGSWHLHRPSEGHSAELLLQPPPPPVNRQTPLTPPPNTLGCPS